MKDNKNMLYEETLNQVTGGHHEGLDGDQRTRMLDKHHETFCPICRKKLEFLGTEEDWLAFVEAHKIVCANR